jgi:tetratricopeptide (TPR) repeat protein
MFRLMGLHPGTDADVHAAAALADTTPAAARELLDALAAAHLVIQVPPDRYGMHDLLRAYAVELATERDEALTRLYDHYLHAAATAMDTVFPAERDNRPSLPKPATGPELTDPDLARAWLDSERANFIAVSAQAGVDHASGLAAVLFRYLDVGGHGVESLVLYGNAARAAAAAGDRTAEAAALISIASAHRRLGRPDEAATVLHRALEVLRETGDVLGQARVWANLGMIESQYRRRYDVAIEHFTAALPLYRQVGARTMEGFVLNSLGDAEMNRDRYPQAVAYFDQSLAVFRELDYSIGEASVLDGFGELAVRQGDHRTAVGFYERSLALFHAAGDLSGESYSRHGLAKARHGIGDLAAAHTDYAAALELFVQTGDRLEEGRALAGLAETAEALGRDDAGERWRAALEIFEDLDAPEAARVRARLAEV